MVNLNHKIWVLICPIDKEKTFHPERITCVNLYQLLNVWNIVH